MLACVSNDGGSSFGRVLLPTDATAPPWWPHRWRPKSPRAQWLALLTSSPPDSA
jgi:hypothetical protein